MTVTINGTTGISTPGVSSSDNIVTTGTGDITSVADMKAASYQETKADLTGTVVDIDCATGNVFLLTTSGTTTFNNPTNVPTSGTAYSFTLQITAGGSHTVDYSGLGTNVKFAGGAAPAQPSSAETDVLVFYTTDGGTTWYGARAIDAASNI